MAEALETITEALGKLSFFIMWIVVSVMTTDQSQPISGTKKCPKCAEYVKAEATLCKHCGSSI
jgi:hypothetical protein